MSTYATKTDRNNAIKNISPPTPPPTSGAVLSAKVTMTPSAPSGCNIAYESPSNSRQITLACDMGSSVAMCPAGYVVVQSSCSLFARGGVDLVTTVLPGFSNLGMTTCNFSGNQNVQRRAYGMTIVCLRA